MYKTISYSDKGYGEAGAVGTGGRWLFLRWIREVLPKEVVFKLKIKL